MARQSWLDDNAEHTMIDDYAKQLGSFLDAMADGKITADELNNQEKRVVTLMKELEPKLDDAMHAKITELLCEMSAFNVMQFLTELQSVRSAAPAWRP